MAYTTFMASTEMKMLVKDLIDILNAVGHHEHVAVKWYTKDELIMQLDEDLSDKDWQIICEEYEQDETIEQLSREFIDQKGYEYQKDIECEFCYKVNCTCDEDTDAYLESSLD